MPVSGGVLKGFANSVPGGGAGGRAPLAGPAVLDIHGWFDPWVPANDTHGCRTGGEPGCTGGGGNGYSWPTGSEVADGWAQSEDGWLYTPVDRLLAVLAQRRYTLSARRRRCNSTGTHVAASASASASRLPTTTGWRRRPTAWDGWYQLHCASLWLASECAGSEAINASVIDDGAVMRCDWAGGHTFVPRVGPSLVYWFLSQHPRQGALLPQTDFQG